MKKPATLGLAGTVLALALTVSPASADRGRTAVSGPTLIPAGKVGPSHGGPAGGPYGYLPLHAREFARAKAAANARAGLAAKPGRPGKGGGGGPIVSTYPNVSPSFNGTYLSGVTPPDTTGAI